MRKHHSPLRVVIPALLLGIACTFVFLLGRDWTAEVLFPQSPSPRDLATFIRANHVAQAVLVSLLVAFAANLLVRRSDPFFILLCGGWCMWIPMYWGLAFQQSLGFEGSSSLPSWFAAEANRGVARAAGRVLEPGPVYVWLEAPSRHGA